MVYQNYGGTTNANTSSASDQNKKIFLGGLSYTTTDDTLRTFCSRFGKMTDCVVMRTAEGKSRGFGFVTYEDTSSVEDFMRARPHTIDTRLIDAKRAMPREDQNSAESHLTVKKLFVAGLRDGIDEQRLREYFSNFGNITEILVMNDRDGKPRGFAFVSFDDYDAVDKVILGKPHIINGRTLDVKKAVPKEKMQEMSGSPANHPGKSSQRNNPGSGPRNNYGQMPDNYDNNDSNWGNSDYNQPPPPSSAYSQQGYNSNTSGFNAPMPPNTSGFSSSYNSMRPNQPPPPPMPQQPMMNYNSYGNNNNSNMPFNSNMNASSNTNFMPPPPPPPPPAYGPNQQTGYGANANNFGNMNNPFNMPPQSTNNTGTGGYNSGSSMPSAFDHSNSYDMNAQNFNAGGANYNETPQQQSYGSGPMRNKRGRGAASSGNFIGNNNPSSRGNRTTPYSTRGGGRGGNASNFGGRGRGRGQ